MQIDINEPLAVSPVVKVKLGRSILLCIAATFFLRCASLASGVLLGLYLAHINENFFPVASATVGLLAASFYATELVGAPFMGVLSDRFGRKLFMMIGPITGGIAIQLMGLTMLLPFLLLVRILEGLSTASSVPATLGFLSAETKDAEALRGRVMAYYEVATVVGIASGVVAAGFLWDRLGFWAFTAVAALYTISLILFAQVKESDGEESAREQRSLEQIRLLRQPRLLRFVPAWLAVNAVVGLWFTHSAFLLAKADDPTQLLVGGFSGSEIGVIFGVFGLVFTLGIYLWGFAFGFMDRTTIMLWGLAGMYLVAGALFLVNRIPEGSTTFLIPLLILTGLGILGESGFTPAALAYLADISEEYRQNRGAVMGLYSVFLGLGQLIGGWSGGPFIDAMGANGLILFTTILASVALACVLLLRQWEGHRG